MKFQCDFCSKREAIVFCLADEAALCNVCDRTVHQANKIASRHERFSLLDPSPSRMPLCDLCQERRALLYCQQDRAILCKDCDPVTHHTNKHPQAHNRFLLAGIKLSTTASNSIKATKITANVKQRDSSHPFNFNSESIVPPKISSHSLSKLAPACNNTANDMKNTEMDYYWGSTSTISEYLTKILPGWKVEDLFDSIASPPTLSESSSANNEIRVPESAKFHSLKDQQRALQGSINSELRREISTEKFIGSQAKSSLLHNSALCVGFKRKRPIL